MDWKDISGPPPTKVTQGAYWGGSQISYTMYLILTIIPFTGLIGVDHFALRSPMTGILKILSIIPLFGFWYFYDIAQACGEKESILKHGIGIPLYGPTGIGKGIFSDSSIPEVNPNYEQAGGANVSPRPVGPPIAAAPIAAVAPIAAAAPPPAAAAAPLGSPIAATQSALSGLASLSGQPVLAGLAGQAAQPAQPGQHTLKGLSPLMFSMYALTTLIFFVIPINKFIAGDYELGILNVILLPLFLPVVIQGLYDIYNLIFNTKSLFETGIARIPGVSFLLGISKIGFSGVTKIATAVATGAALGAAEEYNIKDIDPSKGLTGVLTRLEEELPLEIGKEAAKTGIQAKDAAVHQVSAASGAVHAAENATRAVSSVSKALTNSLEKNPEDALALLGKRPQFSAIQQGGGMQVIPSVPVLLFSVGLLAFSGYVFYMFKNTYKKSEKSDDPPRESRAVREPFKSSK